MTRLLFRLALSLALSAAATAPLRAQARCDQADLDRMTAAYLAAQTSGDTLKLPLADFTQYLEQGEDATMLSGILSRPLRIDFHHTLSDLGACTTFTEVVVADPAHPYVIATRLQFSGEDNPIAPSRVNLLDTTVTKPGDWQFDAAARLAADKAESWPIIPAPDRDSRDALLGAANAYLDWLGDHARAVPLAPGCRRLDGGKAAACDAAPTSPVKFTERQFVVDPAQGAVAAQAFGTGKLPVVHLFRIAKGRIQSIATLAVCASGCGLPRPGA